MLNGHWTSVEDTPVQNLNDTLTDLNKAPGWRYDGNLMTDGRVAVINGHVLDLTRLSALLEKNENRRL